MVNWYYQSGKESDVVLDTKITISRNIEGFPFVPKMKDDQAKEIIDRLEQSSVIANYNLKMLKLSDMDELTRQSLVEKYMLNSKYINGNLENKAILMNEDENICIVLNEKDHLKIQVFASGLELESSLNLAMELEEKLDKELKFAYNNKYGYLTSSPTNLGTGLRASVIAHLPALSKTQNLSKIFEAVNDLGMNIKDIYGEGVRIKGNIYQISNNQSLGLTEDEIIKNLNIITSKIIEQERLARKNLTKEPLELEDRICRSYGILTNARKLTSEECLKLWSDVKLGMDLGIIDGLTDLKVNKIKIYSQSGNLQKYLGNQLNAYERDIERPKLINKIINEN